MKILTTTTNKFYSPSSKRWVEDTELRLFGFKIWTERNFIILSDEPVHKNDKSYEIPKEYFSGNIRTINAKTMIKEANNFFDWYRKLGAIHTITNAQAIKIIYKFKEYDKPLPKLEQN